MGETIEVCRGENSSPPEVSSYLTQCLSNRHPYLVLVAMSVGAEWCLVDGMVDKQRAAVIRRHVEQCLHDGDPLIRLAGAYALCVIRDHDWLRRELDSDASFLLCRPVPESSLDNLPSKVSATQQNAKILFSANGVALRRGRVIAAAGKLRAFSAAPVLQAVANDRDDIYGERESAVVALKALAGSSVCAK